MFVHLIARVFPEGLWENWLTLTEGLLFINKLKDNWLKVTERDKS